MPTSNMPKPFSSVYIFSFCIACLCSCGTVRIYKDPNEPIFYSNEIAPQASAQKDSLNVISFNIKEAEQIDLAISELHQLQKAKPIDVFLLQEMDEKGVEAIAKAFQLNYIYIPIVYNKLIEKNIGNAILTRGIVSHPEKLMLPHAKWVNKRRRHATIGEVIINQKKLLLYSVHTETASMGRKKRMDQVDAILEHVQKQMAQYDCVLIGGDFNTLFQKDSRLVVEKFKGKGFEWPTARTGSTAKAFFGLLKPTHDYLFSKGLKPMSAGKIETVKSSDHCPLFATFKY